MNQKNTREKAALEQRGTRMENALRMGEGEKARNVRGTVRRLMAYMRDYTATLLGVVALVIASTSFNISGPYLMSLAIDEYIVSGDLPGLARIVLLLIGVYIALSLSSWLQIYLMAGVSQYAVRNMRNDFFAKLQVLPIRFFDQKSTGRYSQPCDQ